jgi:hypothetical protein
MVTNYYLLLPLPLMPKGAVQHSEGGVQQGRTWAQQSLSSQHTEPGKQHGEPGTQQSTPSALLLGVAAKPAACCGPTCWA